MDDWMHSKRGVALNQVRHWKREAGGGDIRCPALPLSCYRGSWPHLPQSQIELRAKGLACQGRRLGDLFHDLHI